MSFVLWNVTKQQIVESGGRTMVFATSAAADVHMARSSAEHVNPNLMSPTLPAELAFYRDPLSAYNVGTSVRSADQTDTLQKIQVN